MQTKFGVFRSLFSRKFDEILPRNFSIALANFRWVKRNFPAILAKFRTHWSEILFSEISSKRKFATANFRNSENSHSRNFARAKIRSCEISTKRIFLAVEEGCSENLLFGPLYTISPSNLFSLDFSRTRGFRGDSFHVSQKRSCFIIRRDISSGSER